MSDDEIEAMAARLEGTARVEDAKFCLDLERNENKSLDRCLVANRAAFLRLSAVLLRGAIAEKNIVSAALPKFENEFAEPLFQKLERREEWIQEPPLKESENWFSRNIGELIFLVLLILLLVGIGTVVMWIYNSF